MTTSKIRPMLAAKDFRPDVVQQHLNTDGWLIMQPKIDGMRLLCDAGVPRSRSWKVWTNQYLQQFLTMYDDITDGFDCEMVPGLTYSPTIFREAMSGLRSADGVKEFTLYVFDNFRQTSVHYRDRLAELTDSIQYWKVVEGQGDSSKIEVTIARGDFTARVVLCPYIGVRTLKDIDEGEQLFLTEGWEGAMLRRIVGGYKWNRATEREGYLTKIKRFEDAEAMVVGFEPRYQNDNELRESDLGYAKRSSHQDNLVELPILGALICQPIPDEDPGKLTTFKIGVFRDLSMEDKTALWTKRDELIGRIVKFKHQGYGGGYDKPRTPVFVSFRDPIDLS